MNEYLVSLYIDDELNLDEKIAFVEAVHGDSLFTGEALALLRQEKRLRATLTVPVVAQTLPAPVETMATPCNLFSSWLKPLTGFALATILFGVLFVLHSKPTALPTREELYRFVLYLPESRQAQIIGTFTDWKAVPMERVGGSGYWTLTLAVPKGEHRYSFLIEDGRQIADPTVAAREQDDFGGENTVIEVRAAI